MYKILPFDLIGFTIGSFGLDLNEALVPADVLDFGPAASANFADDADADAEASNELKHIILKFQRHVYNTMRITCNGFSDFVNNMFENTQRFPRVHFTWLIS